MKSDLSPEKIHNQYINGQLDKNSAFELLLSIIENNNETKIRVRSINFIEKLELKDDRVYKTLENLLISDSESDVRSTAAMVIIHDFIDKGLEAIIWALEHDISPRCVNNIIYHLKIQKKVSEYEIKAILIDILNVIKDSKLIVDDINEYDDINLIINDDITNQCNLDQVVDFYLNFKVISYFNENFSEYLNFDVYEGLVRILDISHGTKKLDIKSLEEIEGIEFLTKLWKLLIWNTTLNEISCLENMNELKFLYIGKSAITTITGLNNLKKLERLDLSNNQINEISGLEGLTNLYRLNLSGNQIKEIKGLDNLKNLWELNLGQAEAWDKKPQNYISEIKGLESLTNLINLYLSNNMITEIKGLKYLKNLCMLVVYNNKITEIKGLDSNEKLGLLNLSGNPITEKEREKYKLYPYIEIRFDDIEK